MSFVTIRPDALATAATDPVDICSALRAHNVATEVANAAAAG
jgi:hypothetical protein